MSVSRHILLISYDEMRLIQRRALLEAWGYRVSSAVGLKEAVAACSDGSAHSCDLLILGHSIPFADKRRIIEAFRANVGAPILSLWKPHERVESGVDYVAFSESPEKLLDNVSTILARRAAKASD